MLDQAIASAPASIGNVAVGFDIMGQAFPAAHDTVVATRESEPGVRLGKVSGLVSSLPEEVDRNTALAAASALLDAVGNPFGVRLDVDKGVPMSAGMGGSAASAVAAAAAVNALLPNPFSTEELLPFTLEGERVASDPVHWDNVMASLLGGLVLAAQETPAKLAKLTVPDGVVTIILHPSVKTETKAARAILQREVPLKTLIENSRRLATFVAGCARGDLDLVRAGFEDVLIEPQRKHLLPCFDAVKSAALDAGALGCTFSGSGPSMFAWAEAGKAAAVEAAMAKVFDEAGLTAKAYRSASTEGVTVQPAKEAA
ncbi:homoserine kinase [Sphingomonas piscis]|uniref:Homoserine kinase n=1 Tax=Sphingomonas piscis TaxID=2714943 RepID=A0A6G7YNJ7_9SPHN|nr:homoserine kinase [Sphingomonas piscis]QIK78311.1 homoserine kinase [Sphingomonas piscis]